LRIIEARNATPKSETNSALGENVSPGTRSFDKNVTSAAGAEQQIDLGKLEDFYLSASGRWGSMGWGNEK
jgi:hypothetical protein